MCEALCPGLDSRQLLGNMLTVVPLVSPHYLLLRYWKDFPSLNYYVLWGYI